MLGVQNRDMNTKSTAAAKSTATRNANRAHAATMSAAEAARVAAIAYHEAMLALHDAATAEGINGDDALVLADATNAAYDAAGIVAAIGASIDHDWNYRGIDANTAALVAANID